VIRKVSEDENTAKSGLKTWIILMGPPGSENLTHFKFDDCRQSGCLKIPFSIYFDFYKATFNFTKAVPSSSLPDEEFIGSSN